MNLLDFCYAPDTLPAAELTVSKHWRESTGN